MAIKYWGPIKLVSYDNSTGYADIENVDGSPFICGLYTVKRSISVLSEDEPGEIQTAIQELANKQVGG
jgi:hypothetical protein